MEWQTDKSPYVTVATIRIPAQDAYSPARQRYFDEVMTFRPAHSLAVHCPLGSVMRARLQVYRARSAFRHKENELREENSGDIFIFQRERYPTTVAYGPGREPHPPMSLLQEMGGES